MRVEDDGLIQFVEMPKDGSTAIPGVFGRRAGHEVNVGKNVKARPDPIDQSAGTTTRQNPLQVGSVP